MAEYGMTEEGFLLKPRDKILEDLNARMVAKYGVSFDVSPESPDGQLLGIIADAVHECWLREEAAYNAFIPSKAYGTGLDNLVALNGITRIVNQPTTVLCTLSGSGGVVVPAGSIVETIDGLQFTTNNNVVLPNDVTVTCTTLGAIPIAANEIVLINSGSSITGWTGVNNIEEGVVGIVRQTDPELRAYRASNTVDRGVHTTKAIYQAVSNLNLSHIFVDNNDTDGVVDGVPARSIHVVVEGGNKQEVAQAVFNNLPAGIPTHGSILEVVVDSKGHKHNVRLDRPTGVPVEVFADIVVDIAAPSNTPSLVEQAIVEYVNNLNVGEDLDWSSIFGPILSVPFVKVTSLTIALEGGSHGTVPIVIDSKSRATIDNDSVRVT